MTEEPGRVGLGPAQDSSGTVGDSGWGLHGGEMAPSDLHQQRSDESGKLRAVMRDFGPAWEIERVPPGAAWVAVTRRGSWVHVIAAHDLDTLRTKIEAAEREETPPGAASPGT
jgi:hypothetical protein